MAPIIVKIIPIVFICMRSVILLEDNQINLIFFQILIPTNYITANVSVAIVRIPIASIANPIASNHINENGTSMKGFRKITTKPLSDRIRMLQIIKLTTSILA
jgi:hypothetical protein